MKPNRVRKAKLLIVEGNHERDFFEAWLKHLERDDIQVMPIGGKTLLRESLRVLVKQADFKMVKSLVVVRDADDDPKGAFQSVADALVNAGLRAPRSSFCFVENVTPQTAVLILPGQSTQGALEEFLLKTVVNDPVAPKVDEFIESAVVTLSKGGVRKPPPPHRRGKAKVHAFLATFEHPDRDLGKAAKEGVWDFNHASLHPIEEILTGM